MDHRRRAGVEALLHLNVLGREPYHQLEILTFNSAVQVEFEVREGGSACGGGVVKGAGGRTDCRARQVRSDCRLFGLA